MAFVVNCVFKFKLKNKALLKKPLQLLEHLMLGAVPTPAYVFELLDLFYHLLKTGVFIDPSARCGSFRPCLRAYEIPSTL